MESHVGFPSPPRVSGPKRDVCFANCGPPKAEREKIVFGRWLLVECLPALRHDPNRTEDVLKVDVDEDGNGGGK